jgi:hypothetical protein
MFPSAVLPLELSDVNERLQKTNYLVFKDHNYESVLVGNSRTTYINQEALHLSGKVFNYAVSAMPQQEYNSYISLFQTIIQKQPKYIVMGVDLITGNAVDTTVHHEKKAEDYYSQTQGSLYRFKSLLSLDTLKFSLNDLFITAKQHAGVYDRKQRFYDRKNVKGFSTKNQIDHSGVIRRDILKAKVIPRRAEYIQYYTDLKKQYLNAKFIVFIPPLPTPILKSYHDVGMDQYYFRWLRDMVAIFGEVYNFMYIHDVANDGRNFYDGYHFYPYVGTMIAKQISTKMQAVDDFGVVLTPDNIDEYIARYSRTFDMPGVDHDAK